MSWFGTDLVALSCILGGAAVGGAATQALNQGSHSLEMDCAVEAMAVSPRIHISHGGDAHAIVVAPNVRVHSRGDCGSHSTEVIDIHMDRHMEDFDLQMEQLDLQLEQLDQVLEMQMGGLESQLEATFEQEFEAQAQLEEAMRQLERAKLKVVVRKFEGGGI
jgi:hypothetical protein